MSSRTQIAEGILNEYCRLKGEPLDCHETAITDLMTDLMHLARKKNLDPYRMVGMAQVHLESE